MGKLYVVGDIHGQSNRLNQTLSKIDEDYTEDDCIVFLGDYVDRGGDSLEVIQTLLKVKDEYNVRFLKGNHDSIYYLIVTYFKDFNPYTIVGNMAEYNYNLKVLKTCHIETIQSFIRGIGNREDDRKLLERISKEGIGLDLRLEEVIHLVEEVKELFQRIYLNYTKEVEFLNKLEIVLETDKHIISHSGGDKSKSIKNNTEEDWLWARNHIQSKDTGKWFILGHTPTQSNAVEVYQEIKHILVDTGSVFDNCEIGLYKTTYEYLKQYK